MQKEKKRNFLIEILYQGINNMLKRKRIILFIGLIIIGMVSFSVAKNKTPFDVYCMNSFHAKGTCPQNICQLKCEEGTNIENCPLSCIPKKCTKIEADACPDKYCSKMVDCSGNDICHFKMLGGSPRCGNLAYAGQDVECCEGLIPRCGIEFIDGACDMEGKNSVYNLPICIPCGDDICGQFENRCNCPEDCGVLKFRGEGSIIINK